jgi:chromosome segregation ATPase
MSRSRSQSTNISRYEPHEKIIQDLSTENDELKVLLKKYNDEKEVKNSMKGLNKMVTLVDFEELKKEKEVLQNYIDKDKEAFRKLNKELESCKKMISRHESIYLDLMSKYDKLNVNYKDNEKILDEYNVSFKMLRSQNKELERLNEFQKKANDETNKLFKKTMKSREIDTDELERYYKQYFSMEDEFYKKSYEELKKVHKKLLEFYNELKNECSKTYPHLKKMMNEHNVELKHT